MSQRGVDMLKEFSERHEPYLAEQDKIQRERLCRAIQGSKIVSQDLPETKKSSENIGVLEGQGS